MMESVISFQEPTRNDPSFMQALENETDFRFRRAVERLREGLFDPVAVRLLTAHEERLKKELDEGFQKLEAGNAPHLCLVGAYGQGKSHSLTYLQDRALRENFVTSLINLDPHEIPFHDFREVYRALMTSVRFPGTETPFIPQWKSWAARQTAERDDLPNGPVDLLPREIPHLFKAILTAMAQKNVTLSDREKRLKKHAGFRPQEFPYLLARALVGETIPVAQLRSVFKYRQASFYKYGALTCRGIEPYLRMVRGLARLFRQMGYRGWMLLFDEGESILQGSLFACAKGYHTLDRMFRPDQKESVFFYPVFAFTEDFFLHVQREDYDRVRVRKETEIPYFDQNYAEAWRNLTMYRLYDLSRQEWEDLSRKLMLLHARAYRWEAPEAKVLHEMNHRIETLQTQETRLKLKGLVDHLDRVQQEQVL